MMKKSKPTSNKEHLAMLLFLPIFLWGLTHAIGQTALLLGGGSGTGVCENCGDVGYDSEFSYR